MEVRIVGVVMGVVSLWMVVSSLVVMVMGVVLVRVRRGLQVLVWMRVHVMMRALLLS